MSPSELHCFTVFFIKKCRFFWVLLRGRHHDLLRRTRKAALAQIFRPDDRRACTRMLSRKVPPSNQRHHRIRAVFKLRILGFRLIIIRANCANVYLNCFSLIVLLLLSTSDALMNLVESTSTTLIPSPSPCHACGLAKCHETLACHANASSRLPPSGADPRPSPRYRTANRLQNASRQSLTSPSTFVPTAED